MKVHVHLTGTTPLMTHNVRLANEDDEVSRAIAAINAKRVKTEEDRERRRELQWHGALYLSRDGIDGPVIPTANLKRCFKNAGTPTKKAKTVTQAVHPLEFEVPLVYPGPRDARALYKLPQHVDIRMAKLPGRGTQIQVTRPIWPEWQVEADFELVTALLDYDQFVGIVTQAGVIEGLGDANRIGFGRFEAKVTRA